MHSVMILRHGSVIAETWWAPYAPDLRHMMFSVSKSFTSTAVGLAIADGLFGLDDTIVSLLPEDAPPVVSANLAAMRVRDLLTMTTGHAVDVSDRLTTDSGWAKAILAEPVDFEPGTHFVYNSGATYLLSAIMQRATGQRLLDYLTPRLLDPLGIVGATWRQSPDGVDAGAWGLSITTEDLAHFGQLLLQRGSWNGEQLVPADWVDQATAKQVRTDGRNDNPDWEQGYCFQYWRGRHDSYRGDGAFGQFAVALPELDALVVTTASTGNTQAILDLVWEHLVPAFGDSAQPSTGTLELGGLALATPAGAAAADAAAKVARIRFDLAPNAAGLTALALGDGTLSLWQADSRHDLPLGHGEWLAGVAAPVGVEAATFIGTPTAPVATAGAWVDDHTFVATIVFVEAVYATTITLDFSGDGVTVDVRQNVSFVGTNLGFITGTRA